MPKTKNQPVTLEPDEKWHTTVTITEEMLAQKGACLDGRDNARAFLPVTLSTDPHDNIELAEKFLRTERFWDVGWLFIHFVGYQRSWPDNDIHIGNGCSGMTEDLVDPELDAWIVAQWLAEIADVLATAEGR